MSSADSIATVEYRTIARFPGYRFGDDGTAWMMKRGEWSLRKRHHLNKGYAVVAVAGQARLLHRLILEAFHGSCPNGMVARHFPDRDKGNCRADNLSWGTPVENENDKRIHGTFFHNKTPPLMVGSDSYSAKLTEKDIPAIWELLAAKVQKTEIAKRYRVSETAIRLIAKGENWSQITSERILTIKSQLG
jgi:hypothetical protein